MEASLNRCEVMDMGKLLEGAKGCETGFGIPRALLDLAAKDEVGVLLS